MKACCPALSLLLAACGAAALPAGPVPVVGEAATLVRCAADPESDDYNPFVDEETCLEQPGDRAIGARVREAVTAAVLGVDSVGFYTGDATRTFARSADDGPMDLTFDARAARTRQAYLIAHGGGVIDPEEASYTVGWSEVEIRREGDAAHLSGTLLELLGMGEDSSSSGIEADLRRVDGEWRIRAMREWPIHWAIPDDGEDYDADFWAARDAEVAAARAALAEGPTAEGHRVLVERLLAAMRYREAREASQPLIEGSPNADDLARLARIEGWLGHLEEARSAEERAAAPTAPIRSIATHMRGVCSRPRSESGGIDEEDEGDDLEEQCDFVVLAELPIEGVDGLRGVALVRTLTGLEAREATRLYTHRQGYWMEGASISDGPFVGNQTTGVTRFTVSDVDLADLDGEAPPELRARYERTRIDDGDETVDGGWLVCALAAAACRLFPERTARTVGGGRTTITEHSVTFEGGHVHVRRTSGRADAEVQTGSMALSEALSAR